MFYGDIGNSHVAELLDINKREFLIMGILAVMVLSLGLYPQPLTELTHATVNDLLNHMAQSKIP